MNEGGGSLEKGPWSSCHNSCISISCKWIRPEHGGSSEDARDEAAGSQILRLTQTARPEPTSMPVSRATKWFPAVYRATQLDVHYPSPWSTSRLSTWRHGDAGASCRQPTSGPVLASRRLGTYSNVCTQMVSPANACPAVRCSCGSVSQLAAASCRVMCFAAAMHMQPALRFVNSSTGT